MKKVKVNAYQVALVFKRGVYQRLLTEGTYWLWNENAYGYDITKPFVAPIELNILLQDSLLANALHVVEVNDNEIVLHYENGLLKQVLTAGRYTFWKSVIRHEFVKADISKIDIADNIGRSLLSKAPLNAWVRMSEVQNYEKALLFVEGRYVKVLEPGMYYWWKNSISINVARVDMRQQQLERSEEHTSELQSRLHLVCRLLLERLAHHRDLHSFPTRRSSDLLLSKAPLNAWVRMSEVQNYEKALLFVEGRYVKVLEPGMYYWWKNSISINVARVDMRQQQLE